MPPDPPHEEFRYAPTESCPVNVLVNVSGVGPCATIVPAEPAFPDHTTIHAVGINEEATVKF